MRVLFVTAPLRGHFYPLVPLAWALRSAGHDVRVAGLPGFATTIAAAGLLPLQVGRDVEPSRDDPRHAFVSWDDERAPAGAPLNSPRWFARVAAAMHDDLLQAAREWAPDVLVHEPLSLAAPLVARALGVPAVRHRWGVDATATVAARTWSLLPAGRRASAGPPPAALTIDPCPPGLQAPHLPRGIPMRYVPFNGSGTEPAALRSGAAADRVCVTVGSLAPGVGGLSLVRRTVEAATALDLQVVVALATEHRHLYGQGTDRVLVVESAPLDLVLPHCAAVVHHGGAGTTMTAAVHGCRQLVLPLWADNFAHAERLVAYGAGRSAAPGVAAGEIARQLHALLTGRGHRVRTAALQREVAAQPAPAELVPLLCGLPAARAA